MDKKSNIKSKGRPENPNYEKVKGLIATLKDQNPTWSPARIHIATSGSIFKSLRKNHPTWIESEINAEAKELLPSKSWIRDYVKEVVAPNKKEVVASGLDKSWHLGLMRKPEYNITPEALPYIGAVQFFIEKVTETEHRLGQVEAGLPPLKPLTIRQALWVARLYPLVRRYLRSLDKKQQKYAPNYAARFLWLWAEAYATREHISDLSGTDLDTTGFDKSIRKGGLPVTVDKTTLIFYNDNSFFIDTLDEKLLQQMEQIKKESEK